MNHYLLIINGNISFKITYKGCKFFKLEHLKGTLKKEQHVQLMQLIPPIESLIEALRIQYKGRVEWSYIHKEENKSLFKKFTDLYFSWYKTKFDVVPKFTGTEGKAMKQIIKYLEEISFGDDELAYMTFNKILVNWNELSTFYRAQVELRQINSNIAIILRTLKYGKKATESGESQRNSYREQF